MAATPVPRGSCASIGWLWLTDLHHGQTDQQWLWPMLREEFFDDLGRVHDESGPWDMVLFTGDLVFSGTPKEFDRLTEDLQKLWSRMRELGSQPYLLCVPGNHDLRRPAADSAAAVALRTSWNDSELQRAFWEKGNSDYRKHVERALNAYTTWLGKRVFPVPPDYRLGLLPGDFSATIAKDEARLGIIGLNSTFLQLSGANYEGKLEIDPRQLRHACGSDPADWFKQRHASLLLTHQPPNWLSQTALDRYRGAIYTPGRFVAHFHGHMHESSGVVAAEGGAVSRRVYQGSSLFGLERYGEAFERDRFKFGYAVCRLEMDRDKGRLYLWPRRAEKQQAGHWRIAQDLSYTLVYGEQYTAPEEFSLTLSCGSAQAVPITAGAGAFLFEPAPAPSSTDGLRKEYLELLLRQSVARCAMRWQAAGVGNALARELAEDIGVGAPGSDMVPTASKPVVLLVGPIGAGKSLIGERLHQAAIERALTAPDAPTPVYLEMPSVLGRLDAAVGEAVTASGGKRVQGIALFLHEAIGGETVDVRTLLNEARILTGTWSNTTVVILTRHSSLLSEARDEAVPVPPLPEQHALALINKLVGERITYSPTSWAPSVRDAIRRPLFAVLVASYLRENIGAYPRSKADLVEGLVSRALGQVSAEPESTGRVLRRLAVLSTDHGGGFVPIAEVASQHELIPLLGSGLVTQRGDTLAFPITLLTEWFAARGLVAGEPSSGTLLGDPRRLEHWHYPLVIAAGTTSHEEASRVLAPIVQNDPGLASRIIEEGIRGWGLEEDVSPPHALECGARLRAVMEIWRNALGPLVPLLQPFRPDGTLRPLGVGVAGAWLSAGWYFGDDILEPVVLLQDGRHGSGPLRRGWSITNLRPGRDPAWAWRWARDNIAKSLTTVLRERRIVLEGELAQREAAWLAALLLTGRQYMRPNSIDLNHIEVVLSSLETQDWLGQGRSDRLIQLSPLRAEVARLRASGETSIHVPWSLSDRPTHPEFPETMWQSRSDEEILKRVNDVYLEVMNEYIHLSENMFTRFAHRLAHAVMLPARMSIEVFILDRNLHRTPYISWDWEPLPKGHRSVVDVRSRGETTEESFSDDSDLRRRFDLFRRLRPEAPPWLSITFGHRGIAEDVLRPDAVRELVFSWLENDLNAIHFK